MKLFICPTIFFLKIFCACEYLLIESVYLIEHNFWEEYEKIAEPDKGYLYSVKIASDNKEHDVLFFDYFGNSFYYDNDKKLNYTIVQYECVTEVLYPLISLGNDKKYIRFEFFYTERPFDMVYRLGIDTRQTKWYKNFKVLKQTSGRTLEFTNHETTKTRMHHVYDRFNKLIASNILILNSRIIDEDFKTYKKVPNFELYHFKNHAECFYGLKTFLGTIHHLILVDDMIVKITFKCFEDFYDELNFLKMSFFMNYLTEKLEKKFEGSTEEPDIKQSLKSFFMTACEYIKTKLLNNKIFLPLGGPYTNKYHLDQLYSIILKNISKSLENCINHDLSQLCSQNLQNETFNDVIAKQEEITLKDIYDHEHILEYFSTFLKKDIEILKDYVEIEKVVCDYFNMIKYLSKNLNIQCFKYDHLHTKPIYVDNYKCRIVEGIVIKFAYTIKPGRIMSYNRKGEEIPLTQNVDYFYNLKCCSLFISFENVLSKNIYVIEVISSKNEIIERFMAEEYLI